MIRTFNRFELKYVIRHEHYRRIKEQLIRHMRVDPRAGAGGRYPIASLYYDSHDLVCYREKIDGVKVRRKLRIRSYDAFDPGAVHVEIKQRVDRTVQKRRIRMDWESARDLCRGGAGPAGMGDDLDRALMGEVTNLVWSRGLRPTCITSYQREAYEGSRYERGVRVTFDFLLRYRVHGLDLSLPARNRAILPQDVVVMEIKVNERIPRWLQILLADLEPRMNRLSKYCLAMDRSAAARAQRVWVASGQERTGLAFAEEEARLHPCR
jgi:hypothetical protein